MKPILLFIAILSIQSLSLKDFLNLHSNNPNEIHHVMIGDSLSTKNPIPQIGENSNIIKVVPLNLGNSLKSGLENQEMKNGQTNDVHHYHHVIVHNADPESLKKKNEKSSLQNSKKDGFMSFEDFLVRSLDKKREQNKVRNSNKNSLFDILNRNKKYQNEKKVQPQIIHVINKSDVEESKRHQMPLIHFLNNNNLPLPEEVTQAHPRNVNGQYINPFDLRQMENQSHLVEKDQKISPEDLRNFNLVREEEHRHIWDNHLRPLTHNEIQNLKNFKPELKKNLKKKNVNFKIKMSFGDFLKMQRRKNSPRNIMTVKDFSNKNQIVNNPPSLSEVLKHLKKNQNKDTNLHQELFLEKLNRSALKNSQQRHPLTIDEIINHSRKEEKMRNSKPIDISDFLNHEKQGLRPLESHNGKSHTFNLGELLKNPRNPVPLRSEENEMPLESHNGRSQTVNLADLLRNQKPGLRIERDQRKFDLNDILGNRNVIKNNKLLKLSDLQNLPNTNNKIHTMTLEDILNKKNHHKKLLQVLTDHKINELVNKRNQQKIRNLKLNEILNRSNRNNQINTEKEIKAKKNAELLHRLLNKNIPNQNQESSKNVLLKHLLKHITKNNIIKAPIMNKDEKRLNEIFSRGDKSIKNTLFNKDDQIPDQDMLNDIQNDRKLNKLFNVNEMMRENKNIFEKRNLNRLFDSNEMMRENKNDIEKKNLNRLFNVNEMRRENKNEVEKKNMEKLFNHYNMVDENKSDVEKRNLDNLFNHYNMVKENKSDVEKRNLTKLFNYNQMMKEKKENVKNRNLNKLFNHINTMMDNTAVDQKKNLGKLFNPELMRKEHKNEVGKRNLEKLFNHYNMVKENKNEVEKRNLKRLFNYDEMMRDRADQGFMVRKHPALVDYDMLLKN